MTLFANIAASAVVIWLAMIETVALNEWAKVRPYVRPHPTLTGLVVINTVLVIIALWGIWS